MGDGADEFSCFGARCAPWRQRACVICRPFGVPDIFLADGAASSAIDPGTRFCSASSATGSAEQRGRGHSLRSLHLPQAALPSLPLVSTYSTMPACGYHTTVSLFRQVNKFQFNEQFNNRFFVGEGLDPP